MPQEAPNCHQQLVGAEPPLFGTQKASVPQGRAALGHTFPLEELPPLGAAAGGWAVCPQMSERHKATVFWLMNCPLGGKICALCRKMWGASKFHPITEFKNPIHPSYMDTEREGHVHRSPTETAWVETRDEETPSTPTHDKKPLLFPADSKLCFGSTIWGQFCLSFLDLFFFFLRQFHRLRGNLSCLS